MTASLNPAYIEKVDERGDLQVWIMDVLIFAATLMKNLLTSVNIIGYPYIPTNELWIDREAQHDERQFFIDHLLVEHQLMAEGLPYEKALAKADQEERKERRRAGDSQHLTHQGRTLPDGKDVHEQLWKQLENGISVWIVNGRLVRSIFDIDFTEGGHDHVYEFVPQNEVWIDDAIFEVERGYVLLHELHERNLMAKGWDYNKAHAESSRLEYYYRHHPNELHDKLIMDGAGLSTIAGWLFFREFKECCISAE